MISYESLMGVCLRISFETMLGRFLKVTPLSLSSIFQNESSILNIYLCTSLSNQQNIHIFYNCFDTNRFKKVTFDGSGEATKQTAENDGRMNTGHVPKMIVLTHLFNLRLVTLDNVPSSSMSNPGQCALELHVVPFQLFLNDSPFRVCH